MALNQLEKTEAVIGLIAATKSEVQANLFLERRKDTPNTSVIEVLVNKIRELDSILKQFYLNLELSDTEFLKLIKKVKTYGRP